MIYANVCLSTLLTHGLFAFGVNSNKSQLGCKLIATAEYYLTTSSYLWYALIAVHLYRMLTELRDINSSPRSPLIYYLVGYVLPLVSTGLALGLRQDLFTNLESTLSIVQYPMLSRPLDTMSASLFCWLNVHQPAEIVYALLVPVLIILAIFLGFVAFAYSHLRRNSFKQTDTKLVGQSLVASLVLLPAKSGATLFMFMFLSTSSSLLQPAVHWSESAVYEACYLVCLIILAATAFGLFVLANTGVRENLVKVVRKIRALGSGCDADDDRKRKNIKTAKTVPVKSQGEPFEGFIGANKHKHSDFVDVAEINANKFMDFQSKPSKYILDYNDFQVEIPV